MSPYAFSRERELNERQLGIQTELEEHFTPYFISADELIGKSESGHESSFL